MSITDELREWVRRLDDNPHLGSLTDFGKQGLTNLADRIDAEHRAALEKVAAMVDGQPKLDELDRAVAILEQRGIEDALNISELFVRVEQMERKLNHKGGAE